MVGKAKKIVSLAYKEKLLAEIAHYEKRIEDALNKRKQNSIEDESIEDWSNVTNPYKLNLQPSPYELKQREASLSDRASMTLELGMLTIMQSEVNVMVTPPEVRKPVLEDGIWLEVAAECKIDLVSFTITFYAHKPHRRFAPTRYRSVSVALVKPAHQKELTQSILPKLQLPNLALQVLQSYATAFRSRRTTLLELAERYGDKLRMQAMPEGGYRVKFLELLQVEWTLENLWSPVVPFCHRMKFEVEYMPKDYIQAIGKLYKQFKDPSLGTSERTLVLSKIFEICLQAAEPARELQESFESDPETTGRLHERRTTIDQEPEVPNVEHSPKKAAGKENKPNRKTSMAPPKAIPKKAKKSKVDKDTDRRSVKRTIESESNDAKRTKMSEGNDNTSKGGLKGGKNGIEDGKAGNVDKTKDQGKDPAANDEEAVSTENNGPKKSKIIAKSAKAKDKGIVTTENDANKKGDGKTGKSKGNGYTEGDGDSNNPKKKDISSKVSSEASSKGSKQDAKNSDKHAQSEDTDNKNSNKAGENVANIKNNKTKDKNVKGKDTIVESTVTSTNKTAEKKASALKDKATSKTNVKSKDTDKENAANLESVTQNMVNKNVAKKVTNTKKDEGSVASSTPGSKKAKDGEEVITSKKKNTTSEVVNYNSKSTNNKNAQDANAKEHSTKDKVNTKKVNDTDTVSKTSSKTSKDGEGKVKAPIKILKDTNKAQVLSKKDAKNAFEEPNVALGRTRETIHNTKADVGLTALKGSISAKSKESEQRQENNVDKDKMSKTDKVAEKRILKEKPTETNKNDVLREKAPVAKKVISAKSNEQTEIAKNKMTVEKTSKTKTADAHKTFKKDEVLAKKIKLTQSAVNAKTNNNVQAKSTINTVKSKDPKVTESAGGLKENRLTLQKVTEKSKIQNTNKKTSNMLNVTITKPKIIPLSKLPVEKQTKIADKLKTKIPMMKSKTTFSSLGDKLKGNMAKIGKGVETKMPQKSLPVFKRVAKNMPTRFSPRKLPAFKPSAHGFLNK